MTRTDETRNAVPRPGDPTEGAGGRDDGEVRIDLLTRLAEQAMSDVAFRAEARDDLAGALAHHGYDLNAREMALVSEFRSSLEAAGIDFFLAHPLDRDEIEAILASHS